MSSRQLRKLQQQRELELQQKLNAKEENTSGDEESEPEVQSKPKPSLFAALGGDENDEDEDDEDDEDEEAEEGRETEHPKQEVEQPVQPASSRKSKKNKKKKKAKKAMEATPEDTMTTDEDEIDKAIKELNLNPASVHTFNPATKTAAEQNIDALLGINSTHLKAINEMRQLFGREVLESASASVEADDQARAGGRNRRRGAARRPGGNDLESVIRSFSWGRKTLPEISLRRNPFIQGREHWPMATPGGLTMDLVEKRVGETEYAFVHDENYSSAQAGFFSQVQVGDPNGMIALLQALPYHVSTTLQVGSIARQQGDIALAGELCERALFTFGRVATTGFKQDVEKGKARLDFRRPENRQFWLAGFHYLRSLIRKGTFRTGLEWAKLLFSLDRSDPYCMRHQIQSLAIRAHQAAWYVDFLESLESTGDNRDTNYLGQTVALAKLQLDDVEGARKVIADGIARVPWLYCALCQALELDAPPSIWGIAADAPSRSFWTKLYIHNMKDLWSDERASRLLMEVAKSMSRVDPAALPADDPPVDQGAARLVYLEGETSLIAAAPRAFLQAEPNYEFDPLPPPKEENIFTSSGVQLPFMPQASRGAQPAGEVEQRFRNFLQRHRERAEALRARHDAAEGEGVLTEEELAAQRADEEELQRDLAEYENQPGIFNNLMRMLIGGLEQDADLQDESVTSVQEEEAGDRDGNEDASRAGVPGAWPEDESDGDHR